MPACGERLRAETSRAEGRLVRGDAAARGEEGGVSRAWQESEEQARARLGGGETGFRRREEGAPQCSIRRKGVVKVARRLEEHGKLGKMRGCILAQGVVGGVIGWERMRMWDWAGLGLIVRPTPLSYNFNFSHTDLVRTTPRL